jgi:hypothetical protein
MDIVCGANVHSRRSIFPRGYVLVYQIRNERPINGDVRSMEPLWVIWVLWFIGMCEGPLSLVSFSKQTTHGLAYVSFQTE